MNGAPANGKNPERANESGLDCWLEAVRRRRQELDLEVKGGERAQLVLDQLLRTRRGMTPIAEDFYARAWAALERASSVIADYDSQSQGALSASSQRVREVSKRLSDSRAERKAAPGAFTKIPKESAIEKLEQEHRDAHADDAGLLEARTSGRVPLEHRWYEAARDVLMGGQSLIASLEADRPRLTAAVENAARARAELQGLSTILERSNCRDGGNAFTVNSLDAAQVLDMARRRPLGDPSSAAHRRFLDEAL